MDTDRLREGKPSGRSVCGAKLKHFDLSACGWFFGLIVFPPTPAAAQPRQPVTVAVLPVSDSTSDVEFADGLTDEIAFALTKVPGLAVVGALVSFHQSQRRSGTAAADADYQLDTYRSGKPAGHFTIHVELLKAGETRVLWTKDYDQTREISVRYRRGHCAGRRVGGGPSA